MRSSADGLRLAMFTPLPPARSGIADYVAGLLPLLPEDWQIDAFVDDPTSVLLPPARPVDVHPASEWRSLQRSRPYDLNIYQVGNSTSQAWLWPWVLEAPGLLVLHDAVLHPARVTVHLAAADVDGYRRRALEARPDVGNTLGQLVASGLAGEALYRAFPLCEDLMRSSRVTAVHGELLAGWLRALVPGADVVPISHWQALAPVDPERRRQWRARFGSSPARPLIGSFGHMAAAHRNELALEALAPLAAEVPFDLVLAGRVEGREQLAARAADLGIAERVHFTGPLSEEDFAALMGAVDLALNLRYPTARSSSGTLQQLLQLGVPVVIHDLIHLRDIPGAAVGRVSTGDADGERRRLTELLGLWLRDEAERIRVGAAAAAWAAEHVTPAAMRDSYVAAIGRALGRPPAA